MREDLGAGESGLATVIREAWELLGLISFFTAGRGQGGPRLGDPARHPRPARAAGSIHTDIERGFVAAEVVDWKDLVDAGGYAGAARAARSCGSRAATTSCATAT